EVQINAICAKAWTLFYVKRFTEMEQCGNKAVELAHLAQSSVGLASAEGVLAGHGICTGNLDAAEGYLDRAIPVLQERGDPLLALEVVLYRAQLSAWRLEHTAAESVLREMHQKARELGAGFHLIEAHFCSGISLGNLGRLSESFDMLHEGMR